MSLDDLIPPILDSNDYFPFRKPKHTFFSNPRLTEVVSLKNFHKIKSSKHLQLPESVDQRILSEPPSRSNSPNQRNIKVKAGNTVSTSLHIEC